MGLTWHISQDNTFPVMRLLIPTNNVNRYLSGECAAASWSGMQLAKQHHFMTGHEGSWLAPLGA